MSVFTKCLHALFVFFTLYVFVLVYTHNPLLCGVSKAVLNNAEHLRLTTEQTQWGLSMQDIPFCNVLCCALVP